MEAVPTALRLVAVLVLVAANGVFVAAEFAIVSVRRTRLIPLAEGGSEAARFVLRTAEDPNAFLAATQLGITMASLGLGCIGEPAVADVFEPFLRGLPIAIQEITAEIISGAIAFTFITSLHIVFGELAAKSVALWHPEGTAFVVAPPTSMFYRLFNLHFRFDHARRPSGMRRNLYGCGVARDDDAGEVRTQWVKPKTSPSSSLSIPR